MEPGPSLAEARRRDPMDRELTESERIEREEFTRGHIAPGEAPVEPRPAATVVVARPGGDGGGVGDRGDYGSGMEVLLLRRPERARFAAGAYVFPGGVIDPADDDPALVERFGPGVTPSEAPALVAALREGFEETGLLPADRLPDRATLLRARERLLDDRVDFPSLVRELELSFRGLQAAYFARWVTPARLSRRYDTRFFLVRHRGGEPNPDRREHVEAAWLDPDTSLRRFHAGDLPMLFPTRKTMEELREFDGLEEAFRAYRRRRVEPVRPRLLVAGDDVIPLLPGDPRYEEAGVEGERGG